MSEIEDRIPLSQAVVWLAFGFTKDAWEQALQSQDKSITDEYDKYHNADAYKLDQLIHELWWAEMIKSNKVPIPDQIDPAHPYQILIHRKYSSTLSIADIKVEVDGMRTNRSEFNDRILDAQEKIEYWHSEERLVLQGWAIRSFVNRDLPAPPEFIPLKRHFSPDSAFSEDTNAGYLRLADKFRGYWNVTLSNTKLVELAASTGWDFGRKADDVRPLVATLPASANDLLLWAKWIERVTGRAPTVSEQMVWAKEHGRSRSWVRKDIKDFGLEFPRNSRGAPKRDSRKAE